jgi:hypothetical protein
MSDVDAFFEQLEESARHFPAGALEDDAFRFSAICYAAAYSLAARRVRSEPFFDEALRRRVCGRLIGRYRRLAARVEAAGGEIYETMQLASSVLELTRSSLLADEPHWIEHYPEFQRTLTRAAHALESRAGAPAVEALHGPTLQNTAGRSART